MRTISTIDQTLKRTGLRWLSKLLNENKTKDILLTNKSQAIERNQGRFFRNLLSRSLSEYLDDVNVTYKHRVSSRYVEISWSSGPSLHAEESMAADSDMHAIVKATIASGVIERFSNECRKGNSIAITLTN